MSLAERELEAYETWRFDNGRICELCEDAIAPVPDGLSAEDLEQDPDMDWGFDSYCENCQHKIHLLQKDD
jgi:uncharacterized protein YuzB (UPF0349 family)